MISRWLIRFKEQILPPAPVGSRNYLIWGIAWGLGWATILNWSAASPGPYAVESDARQRLFQLRGPEPAAPPVVVIGIDGQVGPSVTGSSSNPDSVDFLLDRDNYAGLTLKLLKAGAKVVVLNLPSSFVVPQTLGVEDLDAPLRHLIQRYPDRIVLATRSSESFQEAEISIYNHFLPFSSLLLEYEVKPEHVQGVVQYQVDPAGVLRYARLRGEFVRRDSRTPQIFASLEALTLAKFDPDGASQLFQQGERKLLFDPLGPTGQIPIIGIEQVCTPQPVSACLGPTDPSLAQQLKDKIVLVGFVGGYPETFPVKTAYGEKISAVELQGQILSSMITRQFYQMPPIALSAFLVQLVGVVTGVALVRGRQRLGSLVWPLIILAGYQGWVVGQFLWVRWIWPITQPVLVVGLTTLSVRLSLILLQNRQRLQAQQSELKQLRQAEQEAIIDQARKLLYRIATDIHDQELQELKLVMDGLETLQWQQGQGKEVDLTTCDHLLQQLESIGQGIRDQLNDVRTLATKLGISPALRDGLHQGIEIYLDNLIETGLLTLPVERHLQPLREQTTSEWLDLREDILRFLREAIANVIGHVQPPKGNATFISISLTQIDQQCCLEVINDGSALAPARRGGYGTKAMNTIAHYLPKGTWHRIHLPDGRTRVELRWEMPATDPG